VIELYSGPDTAGSFVHCALEYSGAPHKLVAVKHDDDGSVTPSGYLELNPSGTVPTLVDGDLVLYETAAILEYLVETLPGLGPRAGEPGRPELHFWLAWLTNNPMSTFYRWYKADEMIGPDGVGALQAGAVTTLTTQGAWLEQQLAGREWLIGDSPSVADFFLQGLAGWADEIEGLSFGGDAVAAHVARTVALPSVAAALEQEADPVFG
jgi:glutathione S-transferase